MNIEMKTPTVKTKKLKILKAPEPLTATQLKEIKAAKKKEPKQDAPKPLSRSNISPLPLATLTKDQVKTLFSQSPELFDFINNNPVVLKYDYDIFEKYDTVMKGQFLDLKESVINEADGRTFNLIIDNDSRRIAMQQRRKLGITLPELFRNAIWTYLETLTK
ncbi:MAG: hypothetical protein ABIQ31_11135 [Ferruginibacter sp.]